MRHVHGGGALVSKHSPIDIPWHKPSEQPYVVADRRLKRLLRRAWFSDFLKAVVTCVWFAPIIAARFVAMQCAHRPDGFVRRSEDVKDFLGLAVALDSCDPAQLVAEVKDLGVTRLLLRIPVWECDPLQLQRYALFMDALPDCDFVICIMQDRAHVIDAGKWQRAVDTIVAMAWPRASCFQLGQGSNRSKWGFFSIGEFLNCAQYGEQLRQRYQGIQCIGPGILDFEMIPFLHSVVNQYTLRWDAVATSLYVDRRGSPRNTQAGIFDLRRKIELLIACALCSKKIKRRLWITEVNWPLAGQGEYSPCAENLCVNEELYAQYMCEYIEDAWKSGMVERIYWWQLVAKGYGLIDVNDDGSLRRRPAYEVYKKILNSVTI